jgi:hypothetical protein
MIVFIYCKRGKKGTRPAEEHTLKIDLSKITKEAFLKTLGAWDYYNILSYKPAPKIEKVYHNGKLIYRRINDHEIRIY